MHYGSGSVIPSRTAGFTNTGSPRPSRPGQLDQMMADNIAGGADPAQINEMSHLRRRLYLIACITRRMRRWWNVCLRWSTAKALT